MTALLGSETHLADEEYLALAVRDGALNTIAIIAIIAIIAVVGTAAIGCCRHSRHSPIAAVFIVLAIPPSPPPSSPSPFGRRCGGRIRGPLVQARRAFSSETRPLSARTNFSTRMAGLCLCTVAPAILVLL